MLLKNSLSLHQNTLLNFSLFVPSKLEARNTFVSFLRDFSPLKRDEVEEDAYAQFSGKIRELLLARKPSISVSKGARIADTISGRANLKC